MKRIAMGTVAVAVLALVAACGSSGSGGGGGGGTTGNIAGNVVDATTGTGIGSATLSINGGSAITANAQGYFFATGITASGSVTVCAAATNYVTRCRIVAVEADKTLSMTPTQLMVMGAGKELTDGAGTVTADGTSGMVTATAGTFCDANGTAVAGNVTCHMTPLDVSARAGTTPGNNLSLAPGNFTGLQLDGTSAQLVSGGMMDIYCTDAAGTRVNICSGKTPTIRIPIYDADCANNTKYPNPMKSWGMNETTGLWEEVASLAKTCGADVTASYYEGTITHLSYWNADQVAQTTCLTGTVTSDGTTPVDGALVSCIGTDYNGQSEAYTSSTGTFCVPVMAGGAYSCVAQKGAFVSQTPLTGTASATAAQCGGEGCTAIGTFTLTDPLMRTVLTWGATPSDLDSHFVGGSYGDVYFAKDINPHMKELIDGKMGSLAGDPFVALDTDDTSAFGPEITSAVPGVAAGTYRFCVHNYLGQSSGLMEASGAIVNVVSAGVNQEYTIPTSNPNNYNVWRVYQVVIDSSNAMTFTTINDYVNADSADAVAAACMQ